MAAEVKIIVSSASSGSALKDTKNDVENLSSAAGNSSGGFNMLQSVGTAAFAAVAAAGVAAVAGVGTFVSSSVTAAGAFESSVNGLAAVAGNALGQAGFSFDDVKNKALQLGMDTAFSAQQSITAMTELVKGGVPIKDVMGQATDATLALASAAKLDLGQSAEIVAKQLGVWGETGVTAVQVSDLLASAANASVVGVDDLALGLANAGGSAKTAGVDFGDLVQTMALISPNFSSAADAGTSLKTFITRLIPSTKPATEAMIALGLATEDGKSKFYDAQGSFIGMEAAARLLHSATKDLSEEQKSQAFNTIFGSDAIRAAASIANAGADGFNAMGQSMADAGGAAAAAATQNQGFGFAVDQMKGSLETLQIVIGSALLPTLTSLVNDVITPGINAVLQFAMAVTQSNDPLGTFMQKVQEGAGALGTMIITALPGVVAGLGELATTLISWVTASLPGWLEALGSFQQGMIEWVVNAIPGLLVNLGLFVQLAVNFLMDHLPAWVAALTEFAIKAIGWIADALPGLANNLGAFFNWMISWVVDSLPKWGANLAELGGKIAGWVLDALPGLGTNLGTTLGVILGWLAQTIVDVAPKLLDLAITFFSWVAETVIPALPGALATIATALWNFISSTMSIAGPKLVELGTKFYKWVSETVIPALPGALEAVKTTINGWISGALSWAGGALKGIGRSIVQSLIDGLASMFEAVKRKLGELTDMLPDWKGPAQRDATLLYEAGRLVMGGFNQGLIDTIPLVKNTLAGLTNDLRVSITPALAGGALLTPAPQIGGSGSIARVGGGQTINNTFNYSPTYGSAPNNPSADFALMAALATRTRARSGF